jgi:chitodextrinase
VLSAVLSLPPVIAGCGGQAEGAIDAAQSAARVDNLFVGATNTTPPDAPTDLSWNNTDGTVVLSWVAPANESALTYRLFYGSYDLGVFADSSVAVIGFKPGTPYTFTVKAVDPAGNVSLASNTVTVLLPIPKDTAPPSPPGNLTLSNMSSTAVWLRWTASLDDVGVVLYQIYVDDVLVQTLPATTSATVSLAPNLYHDVVVKAVDGAGNVSSASNLLRLLVGGDDPEVPSAAPTNLHVTDVTATTVSLAWTPPSADAGAIAYDVFGGVTLIAMATAPSVTVSSLTAGTTYTFTVKARDSAGNVSAPSNAVVVTTSAAASAPAAPTQLQASNTAGIPVRLVWTPGTGGTPAVTYQVYRDGLLVLTTTLTSVVVTTVSSSATYSFTVKAVDAAGHLSATSAPATITTSKSFDSTPPSRPSHLKVTGVTSTSVGLAWSSSTDNVGVIAYQVFSGSVLVGMPAGTSTTISGLQEGRSYDFTVKALDAVFSLSRESATVTVTTGAFLDATSPTTPTNLSVVSVAPWTAKLIWTGSTDSGTGVAGYDVYVKYINGSNVTLALVASSATTAATVNDLYAGTYSLLVRARDAVGNESADSNTAIATIPSP